MAHTHTTRSKHFDVIQPSYVKLALAASMFTLAQAIPVWANDPRDCDQALRGAVIDDCSTGTVVAGENTEVNPTEPTSNVPFKISVDGESVTGSDGQADTQRRTDVGLDAVDIQVKFDGLDAKQILNAKVQPIEADNSKVQFRTSTNYARFIKTAEIRIFKGSAKDESLVLESDPIAVIDANSSDIVEWKNDAGDLNDHYYVYRVYDDRGRFDETRLQPIVVKNVDLNTTKNAEDLTADNVRVRNISVYGGAVTVFGRNIPEGYDVNVFGQKIHADASNQILFQQILPPGDQDVDIAVNGGKGSDLQFTRQISIPKNDWFYVALADLTVGRRTGGVIEATSPGEFEKTYTKGRLAFYLKGKIKGKYLLTASVDTEEGELGDLFRNLDRKDPRSLLRRLDPDDYYPIYGDDSTITEDAPTSGKAYVRLERGQSHVMWGNFKTTINGTEFARSERGLYGAHAVYKSEAVTSFGEPKASVEAYVAQPGTVPQRDDFLGTGGSAYFLRHQDINSGTEQVVVEHRDSLSNRIVSRTVLTEGTDYRIDYLQGVIILTRPLATLGTESGPVVGGASGANQQHLIVNYETTPTIGDENGLTASARGQGWLGDHIRVGATASQETISTEKNSKIEADLTLRATDNTSLTFEVAQSEGRGIGQSLSSDGGLTFLNETPVGARGNKALAYRVKAVADLSEISNGALSGKANAYYEYREAGFSAVAAETATDTEVFGGDLELNVSETTIARLAVEGTNSGPASRTYRVSGELEAEIAENLTLVAGVTWTRFSDVAKFYSNGDRTDLGAKLTYEIDEDNNVFVFGQATVNRTGNRLRNDRIGLGGEAKLSDKWSIGGDVSYGTSGIGGSATVNYKRDEDTSYYLGYRLDPDRDVYKDQSSSLIGTDAGVIIAGANTRLNDWTTAFTEANVDLFGQSRTIGQVYGLTFTPDETWSTSLGMSLASVTNPYGEDFDRKLFMARAAYSGDDLKASLNGEVRLEDSDIITNDRTTYLLQANANYKTDENWRVLASLDAVLSKSNAASILDGDYIEASIGATYRPVDNDKLNLLFKYTYLYDLPGAQQVNSSGNILGPAQRSHVLSLDATYDLNEWLSIGGKYGYRFGAVSTSRDVDDFISSTAHLGIIRADLHIVKNWDVLVEARALHAVEAKQTDYGFLAAAYRHIGDNMKIGVGYNFGRFSDDLTDLTYDDQGVFLNVIGKF